tara:strand:- start:1381 stop:2505 length:1125 start_codon:yes stop_codon:yes gene_type:complete
MFKFNIYIIKEILLSFLLLVTLLTGILWLGQGLRHIDLLTSDNISFVSYISYIVMLLPKITTLTIPISLFLTVLVCLNRLRTDSELLILWASGKSNASILLKPILLISIPIFCIYFLITIAINPYSLNEIRQKIIEIRSSGINSSILQERKFVSPTDTLTIFIQERDGNEIDNLLIHDLKNRNKPQTYIAQKGEFISEGNIKLLRLFNGNIQIFDKSDQRISEIEFDTYDLDLSPYNKVESSHRYSDELFTKEIYNNLRGKSLSDLNSYEREQFAEINNRIISPLYLICLSILPLLALNYLKSPSSNSISTISTISLIALIIKILEISLSNLLIENNYLVYLNYFIPLFILFLLLALIVLDNSVLNLRKYVFKN